MLFALLLCSVTAMNFAESGILASGRPRSQKVLTTPAAPQLPLAQFVNHAPLIDAQFVSEMDIRLRAAASSVQSTPDVVQALTNLCHRSGEFSASAAYIAIEHALRWALENCPQITETGVLSRFFQAVHEQFRPALLDALIAAGLPTAVSIPPRQLREYLALDTSSLNEEDNDANRCAAWFKYVAAQPNMTFERYRPYFALFEIRYDIALRCYYHPALARCFLTIQLPSDATELHRYLDVARRIAPPCLQAKLYAHFISALPCHDPQLTRALRKAFHPTDSTVAVMLPR